MQMDHSAMDMGDAGQADPDVARQQEIAMLLGYSARQDRNRAAGKTEMSAQAAFDPGTLAVAEIYERIGGTCSACHARYRQGRN